MRFSHTMKTTRSVICSVLGHVDHGKSSLLDIIRGTAIVKSEPGAITQNIGASFIPIATIKKICGSLLKTLQTSFSLPGLLFIDTPGHAAFSNLRKRGGNLADIAILVVDINEGFMPQTEEALSILLQYKTPFILVANKLDMLPGWRRKQQALLPDVAEQELPVQRLLEEKIYQLVGILSQKGFKADRFDRVEDYSQQITVVPCSAKTGEGIAEVLMMLTGLAQKFLEDKLQIDEKNLAQGTVLEVKKEKGLGVTLDVILYDGSLHINDVIVIGGVEQPIITKVKALFEPNILGEMHDKKTTFTSVTEIKAAAGVKLSATNIEEVIAGMPFSGADSVEQAEEIAKNIQTEVDAVSFDKEKDGIVIKADTLGSLEALLFLLKEKNIPVRKAAIGNITRNDIADASTVSSTNPLFSAILGFNVKTEIDVVERDTSDVIIFIEPVIYSLVEKFETWQNEKKTSAEQKNLQELAPLCKIKLLKQYIFRQNNPAIVGAEVLAGKLVTGIPLMSKENTLTSVKGIQLDKKSVSSVEDGKQVAVSLDKVSIGRQLQGDEVLYSVLTEHQFQAYKDTKELLSSEQKEILKEIAVLMREKKSTWGL